MVNLSPYWANSDTKAAVTLKCFTACFYTDLRCLLISFKMVMYIILDIQSYN